MKQVKQYEQPELPDESYYRNRARQDQARRWGRVLLVIGIIWLVFELTGRGAFFRAGLGFVEQTQRVEQTLAGHTLKVDVGSDDVELVHSDGADIRIEATKHAFGWNSAAVERELQDIALQIQHNDGIVQVGTQRQPGWWFGRAPYTRLRIAVPDTTRLDIQSISGDLHIRNVTGDGSLTTTSGDIRAENTQGHLAVKTTNGDIRLDQHQGALAIETVNGDVELKGGQARDVTASSINGDLTLEGVSGKLMVNTISGEVRVDDAQEVQLNVESTNGDLDFRGSLASNGPQRITNISGDVRLRLPSTSNVRLDVNTLSGDLETNLALRNLVQTRRELRGVLGAGAATLEVNTTSGDVHIQADS